MPYNLIWSCLPNALAEYRSIAITQGPVDDAERAGISVKKIGQSAFIRIQGLLMQSAPRWATLGGYASSYRDMKSAVAAAIADGEIDQIVLFINSPGGSVSGVDETALVIRTAAEQKPVIAQVEGQMASAAYYLGSQATEIRAGRGDLIGSIGTRLVLWDTSKMFEEAGIDVRVFDTGPYKTAGEPGTKITEDQADYFQSVVDAYQAQFKETVMAGRQFTENEFETVSDGRMWLAEESQQLGLVDTIRTADQTLADAAAGASVSRRKTADMRQRLLVQQMSRTAAHSSIKRANQ